MHHGHTWAPVEPYELGHGKPAVVYACGFCSAEPTTDPDWRGQCARDKT